MTRTPNTSAGDRRRDRAARRARVAPALEGNHIRVRAKRLDQVDVEKLTLAYWLLAKELVADKTTGRDLTGPDVRVSAEQLDDNSPVPSGGDQAGGAEARS